MQSNLARCRSDVGTRGSAAPDPPLCVIGIVDQHRVLAGSATFLTSHAVDTTSMDADADRLRADGASAVYVSIDNDIAGVFAIRKGLAKPIGSLTQMGTIRLGKRTDNRSPKISEFVPLASLNDIVFDRQGGFWFTDNGKGRDRDLDRGGVYYAKSDGSFIAEVIYPMLAPNGLGLSPDEDILYVAETHTGRMWSFEITAPGQVRKLPFPSPNGGTLLNGLPGFQLLDSLAIDSEGNVCVATLYNGGISVIAPSGALLRHVPTHDPFTTNICFGGPTWKWCA